MSETAPAPWKRHAWRWGRIGVSVAAFIYLARIIPLAEVRSAVARLSGSWALVALLLSIGNTLVATLRWRLLLHAYGADAPPRTGALWRQYLIANFYGTFLPGGVGGDIVRAVACRDAFASGGVTASMGVVFVDRALGLAGLLIVASCAFLFSPLAGVDGVLIGAVVGVSLVAACVAALALGPRLAPHLPGVLGRLAGKLPVLRSLPSLAGALGLSFVTHSIVAATGHVLIASLTRVTWMQSLVIVPLTGAAQYLPITVAGAGAREAAFVVLYRGVGVADADALTASLGVFACQLAVAALGGLLSLGVAAAPEQRA